MIPIRVALQVVLGLWLGGICWLMWGVQSLFAASRPTAIVAAPILFHAFEPYQLLLGAIGVLLAALLWLRQRTGGNASVALLSALALLAAAISRGLITPRIDALREAGQSATATFKSLHGISMALYSAQVLLLRVALSLAAAICARRSA